MLSVFFWTLLQVHTYHDFVSSQILYQCVSIYILCQWKIYKCTQKTKYRRGRTRTPIKCSEINSINKKFTLALFMFWCCCFFFFAKITFFQAVHYVCEHKSTPISHYPFDIHGNCKFLFNVLYVIANLHRSNHSSCMSLSIFYWYFQKNSAIHKRLLSAKSILSGIAIVIRALIYIYGACIILKHHYEILSQFICKW